MHLELKSYMFSEMSTGNTAETKSETASVQQAGGGVGDKGQMVPPKTKCRCGGNCKKVREIWNSFLTLYLPYTCLETMVSVKLVLGWIGSKADWNLECFRDGFLLPWLPKLTQSSLMCSRVVNTNLPLPDDGRVRDVSHWCCLLTFNSSILALENMLIINLGLTGKHLCERLEWVDLSPSVSDEYWSAALSCCDVKVFHSFTPVGKWQTTLTLFMSERTMWKSQDCREVARKKMSESEVLWLVSKAFYALWSVSNALWPGSVQVQGLVTSNHCCGIWSWSFACTGRLPCIPMVSNHLVCEVCEAGTGLAGLYWVQLYTNDTLHQL